MDAGIEEVSSFPKHEITGVILAGGRARRMGSIDKGLLVLSGRPMVEHVLDSLRPQVGSVLINANRNLEHYATFGCKVIPDTTGGYLGPLAGMASAMQAVNNKYVLTVPCDSPFIANDLAERLYKALIAEGADISVAHDGQRVHPVFALLRRGLLPSLLAYLDTGERKIDGWFARHGLATAYFSDIPEAFLNVNRPEEHSALEIKCRGVGQC